jgi:O-antigen/teichoic acid export membrane protein
MTIPAMPSQEDAGGTGMAERTHSGPAGALLGVLQRNRDLLRNAGSLAGTTGLTSVFGVVFWIIAAREFSQQAVGYGSTAISAMTLLGTVGMFGLGTMLIGELPRLKARGGLFAATLVASGLGSLVLGLGFPLVASAFGGRLPEITGTPARLALFVSGVALTGATLVLDEGTIGLLRGGVQLSRNLAMSAIKLAALPVAAVVLHDEFGVGLLLAWVLGTLLSLVPTAIMLRRGGSRVVHRPDWGLLRRLGKVAMAHNWLNLAIATPPKLIPVLVTAVVSPSSEAAYYVAWMMASFLFMVPASLSTVLFAIASAAPELIAEKLRFVLRLSVLIGVPAMVVLALSAHFALGIFGANYARLATVPLWLLILGYLPGLPKAQYIAVCRATGKVAGAAVLLTVSAGCELAAVVIGGKLGGLNGLSYALLGVVTVEGIVTAPTVLRAAYAQGAKRRATGPIPMAASYVHSQQAGLAALVALASAAVAEGHTLDAATELWRTGSFPVISSDPDPDHGQHQHVATDRGRHRRHKVPAVTTVDLFRGQPADLAYEDPGYRHRQLAGLDVLIAMATPEIPRTYLRNFAPGDQSGNLVHRR